MNGYVWLRSAFPTADAAFAAAESLLDEPGPVSGAVLNVIGEFILPPPGGEPTRPFQTLHFDFGVPLHPRRDQDVARYTALHIPPTAREVTAVTRLVPLDALLAQRRWPNAAALLDNLIAYGASHGAWDDADGYTEGSLARLLEAAAGETCLPSVKSSPGFLCGLEFDSLAAELRFFERLGLDIATVQVEIDLGPGDLLLFDNLSLAHGRRGARRPGELHQRVYGHSLMSPQDQCALRDRFLAGFGETLEISPGTLAAQRVWGGAA